jgi:hypothetical protein
MAAFHTHPRRRNVCPISQNSPNHGTHVNFTAALAVPVCRNFRKAILKRALPAWSQRAVHDPGGGVLPHRPSLPLEIPAVVNAQHHAN